MWKRLRRKSMAPTRPVLFPEQYGLALVTVIVIVAAVAMVVVVLR
jgi:hypothetical protein